MSLPELPPSPVPMNLATLQQGQGYFQQYREQIRRVVRYLWVPSWSLPAQCAVLTFTVLAGCTLAAWLIFRQDPSSVPWQHALTPRYLVTVALLIGVIPFFVQRGVRAILEADKALFPDIDFAWTAGLKALHDKGLSLQTTPVYLILGSAGEELEIPLLTASGRGFRVRGVPEGPAALHWYAHPDAIYLCCSEASVLSGVGLESRQLSSDLATGRLPTPTAVTAPDNVDVLANGTSGPEDHPTGRPLKLLTRQQASLQSARLETVGRLLRAARDPLCPVNGVLLLLPQDMIDAAPREIQQLADAVDSDLRTIQMALQVRPPVTAVVTGMEHDPGFRELMRRVGVERTGTQRFGQRYDLRAPSGAADLRAFSEHLCGTFEDWAHALFREENVLSRPGNTHLFALLCRVRSQLKGPLAEVLSSGIAGPRETENQRRELFSGCYFVATGKSPDTQGFVRGVIDKLESEQDVVEWLPAAQQRGNRWKSSVAVAIALSVLFAGLLVTQLALTRLP